MAFYAYILQCGDGSYYTGHTDDISVRIVQHQSGKGSSYTASHQPVKLVWSQCFETREQAKQVETQVKGWNRKKKMALIEGHWEDIPLLSGRGKANRGLRDALLREASQGHD